MNTGSSLAISILGKPKYMVTTREEFESEYNAGGIKELVLHGRLSIECRCSEDMCEGWKMTHLDWLQDDIDLYGNTELEIATAISHRDELLKKESKD